MGRILGLKQCPVFEEPGDVAVTTEYGKNSDYASGYHNALDIVRYVDRKHTTANITAIADGEIYKQRGYVKDGAKKPSGGNVIGIRHKDGHLSVYMHLKENTVPEKFRHDGAKVFKGDVIGYMGSTGDSTGDHLHIEIWRLRDNTVPTSKDIDTKYGDPVNPEPYLKGEKIIGGEETIYEVHIGELKSEQEAKEYQTALKKLGTASYIIKK